MVLPTAHRRATQFCCEIEVLSADQAVHCVRYEMGHGMRVILLRPQRPEGTRLLDLHGQKSKYATTNFDRRSADEALRMYAAEHGDIDLLGLTIIDHERRWRC